MYCLDYKTDPLPVVGSLLIQGIEYFPVIELAKRIVFGNMGD
jgi:hypothetical protein